MDIVMISDIKADRESILSYSLHLCKYLQESVRIVHIIDPRIHQGVTSQTADSSSVAPGAKMTHSQIIEREQYEVAAIWDRLLSKEVSRLNFPLKYEVIMHVGSVTDELQKIITTGSLLILSQEPDGDLFQSANEIAQFIKGLGCMTLLVPSGIEFSPFLHVLIPTGFSEAEIASYPKMSRFLADFQLTINGIGAVDEGSEEKTANWKAALKMLFPKASVQIKLTKAKHFDSEFVDYVNRIEPDLTVIVSSARGFWEQLFSRDLIDRSIVEIKTPVLVPE